MRGEKTDVASRIAQPKIKLKGFNKMHKDTYQHRIFSYFSYFFWIFMKFFYIAIYKNDGDNEYGHEIDYEDGYRVYDSGSVDDLDFLD